MNMVFVPQIEPFIETMVLKYMAFLPIDFLALFLTWLLSTLFLHYIIVYMVILSSSINYMIAINNLIDELFIYIY